MAVALALGERGLGRTGDNPSVGCVIVSDGRIVGRGWTQSGGRPHAEAMALALAGQAACGSTIYVTLEPCAHKSERGPSCADLLVAARPKTVVMSLRDPDPRTAGRGTARLCEVGIQVIDGILATETKSALAGYLSRTERGRPYVTLKLATSLDGAIAMADGSSRWITGEASRAHVHIERARSDAILVGAGTVRADAPRLDVRVPGLADRTPRRIMLGSGDAPGGWEVLRTPEQIELLGCNNLLVEGGANAAASFIKAGLVDRLLLYRAAILIGGGKSSLDDIGLKSLDDAHGQWWLKDARQLGNDRLAVYEKSATG